MAECDICGVSFGEESQVRAHIQGSKGDHSGIGYANADEYIVSGNSSRESSGSGGGGGSQSKGDNPLFSETTDTSDVSDSSECCGSPSLEGSSGDHYKLDDGSVVQLEKGDSICTNCDTIHD